MKRQPSTFLIIQAERSIHENEHTLCLPAFPAYISFTRCFWGLIRRKTQQTTHASAMTRAGIPPSSFDPLVDQ